MRIYAIRRPLDAEEHAYYSPGNFVCQSGLPNANAPGFKMVESVTDATFYLDVATAKLDILKRGGNNKWEIISFELDE